MTRAGGSVAAAAATVVALVVVLAAALPPTGQAPTVQAPGGRSAAVRIPAVRNSAVRPAPVRTRAVRIPAVRPAVAPGRLPLVPQDGSRFADRLLRAASGQVGVPYAWGGGGLAGPSRGLLTGAGTIGFDCSGLVRFAVFQASGGEVVLPRTADAQTRVGVPVPRDELRPGDVVSFTRSGDRAAHHVGIYAGLGRMIHAPSTGGRVRVESLGTAYWRGQEWRAVRYSG